MKKYTQHQLDTMTEIKPASVITICGSLIISFFIVLWLVIWLIDQLGWLVLVSFAVGVFASAGVWSVYHTFKQIKDEKYIELDIDDVYPKKK